MLFFARVAPPPLLNASRQSKSDAGVFDVIIFDLSSLTYEHPNSNGFFGCDMNVRISLLHDYIIAEQAAYLPVPDDYIEGKDLLVKRRNEDKVNNWEYD